MATMEYEKKELGLNTNAFGKAVEYKGKKAWFQLILNLLFLRPGTYPSIPTMGIGIQDYEYEAIDDVKDNIQMNIQDQIKAFLPDIPLDSVELETVDYNGQAILLITINLIDDGQIVTGAIASETSNKLINFEISWT